MSTARDHQSTRELDENDQPAVAREQSHVRVTQNAAIRAARDRILRAAFLLDLYGVRILGFDLLAMRERLEVDSTFARVC